MIRGFSGDDIINGKLSGRGEFLIRPYLAAGETMMLYAPTGQGKTINALMLSVALTTGTDFYDWKIERPVPVLFVEGGELTAYGISDRMRAIYARKGITTDQYFHLKAPTKEYPFVFDITKKDHQEILTDYIMAFDIEVVVFDNYNSLRAECDNEFLAWKKLEEFLSRLKSGGVASVVVHHTNKEGKRQSGVQRKEDYCDLVLRIQKSELSTKNKVYIEIEMEKFRWGESLPTKLVELVFKENVLDLLPADYEAVLAEAIKRDANKYDKGYLREKYKFLGYKLMHYLDKPEENGLVENFLLEEDFRDPNDFF